jgi:hypothetical protein
MIKNIDNFDYLARMQSLLKEDFDAYVSSISSPSKKGLRVNTLKISVVAASTFESSTCYVRLAVTASKADGYVVAAGITISNNGASVSYKTFSIDVSELTGKYYCVIPLYGSGTKDITFDKLWLE